MPSTWSSRFRLNYQAPGENLNTWGGLLNTQVFQLLEDAIAKRVAFSLSGSKTLTTANGAEDEARCAFLDVTSGTGGTITIPPLEKIYLVRNATSGEVIVTTGAGAVATVAAGFIVFVVCDASNVRLVQSADFAGQRVTNVGLPVAPTDAVNKNYADALAFNTVNLPGQGAGTVGQFIQSDGATASWASIGVADVAGAAPLADPEFTGDVEIAGSLTVAGGVVQSGGTVAAVTAIAAADIDFSENDVQTKSISANTAFTFSGLITGKAQAVIVKLTITSLAVPSWPASVVHPNGVNPSINLGNGTHYLGLITADGGAQVLLVVLGRKAA